jgi:energy-converting hydrogenase Eha subunit G
MNRSSDGTSRRNYNFRVVTRKNRQMSSIPPAASDTWIVNFTGFTLVPEPSLIGLVMVGAGALFMLRRRR